MLDDIIVIIRVDVVGQVLVTPGVIGDVEVVQIIVITQAYPTKLPVLSMSSFSVLVKM
jgi:hypothetical protein